MATHSSSLAWKIPWAEEPGRLQSMGSLRVGTSVTDADLIPGLGISLGVGNGHLLLYSCLGNPMDRRALQASDYEVAELDTAEQLSTQKIPGT